MISVKLNKATGLVISLIIYNLGLFARIPSIYLNGFQKIFESNPILKNHLELNPILGFIFSSTHLAYNSRFYGNYEFGWKTDNPQKRSYSKDKAQDETAMLIKELFPSPGGTLTTTVKSSSNLGYWIDEIQVTEEKISVLTDLIMFSAIQRDKAKQKRKKSEASDAKEKKEKDHDPKDQNQQVHESIISTLKNILPKMKSLFSDLTPENINNNLNRLVNKINKTISGSCSNNLSDFYPPYFTEQILLGFAWEVLNTKEELESFLIMLHKKLNVLFYSDQETMSTENFNFEIEPFTKEKLSKLNQKIIADIEDASWEELFQQAYFSEFFNNVTPYRSGATLKSNGSTLRYDRPKNVSIKNDSFQDCVEIVIRHLVNIKSFNPVTRTFEINENYSENLKIFLKTQAPDKANDGSSEIRDLWNKVVADLNYRSENEPPLLENESRVVYLKKGDPSRNENTNEIVTGFTNILKILSIILEGKTLLQNETDNFLRNVNAAIKKFENLFENKIKINKQSLLLSTSQFNHTDLFGELEFEIGPQRFNLSINHGHAKLDALKNNNSTALANNSSASSPDEIEVKNSFTKKFSEHFPNEQSLSSVYHSILITMPKWIDLNKLHPFYILNHDALNDNFSKLWFLEELFFSSNNNKYQERLINLLISKNEIAWNDQGVQDDGFYIFLMIFHKKLQQNFSIEDASFNLEEDCSQTAEEYFEENNIIFKESKQKPITNITTIRNRLIPFPETKNLKVMNLSFDQKINQFWPQDLEELEIDNCSSFHEIPSWDSCKIKKLILNSLQEDVSKFQLPETVEELEIRNCFLDSEYQIFLPPALKKLKLNRAKSRKIPSLLAPQLESLSLTNISLSTLTNIPETITEITLNNCRDFNTNLFNRYPNIKKLHLLECQNIQYFNLNDLNNIEELSLINCKKVVADFFKTPELLNIKKLTLDNASCENIDMKKLHLLQKLSLKNCFKVNEIPENLLILKASNTLLTKETTLPKNLTILKYKPLKSIAQQRENNALSIQGLENIKRVKAPVSSLIQLFDQMPPNIEEIACSDQGGSFKMKLTKNSVYD